MEDVTTPTNMSPSLMTIACVQNPRKQQPRRRRRPNESETTSQRNERISFTVLSVKRQSRAFRSSACRYCTSTDQRPVEKKKKSACSRGRTLLVSGLPPAAPRTFYFHFILKLNFSSFFFFFLFGISFQ